MPISDLKLFTKDSDRVGENVARTIRLVAKILMDWSNANANNKEKSKLPQKTLFQPPQKPPPLDAITFDKLVVFFCRLWSELHKQKKVRYNPAFIQRRGFHGPGRAMKIDRFEDKEYSLGDDPNDLRHGEWAYMTEVAEKLKTSFSNTRTLFKIDGKPYDPRCKVYSGLDNSVWETWLFDIDLQDTESRFLTYRESKYIDSISLAFSKLNKKEIRTIGTHCSPSETCKDIEFNLTCQKWKRRQKKTGIV